MSLLVLSTAINEEKKQYKCHWNEKKFVLVVNIYSFLIKIDLFESRLISVIYL